jgi:hypothetical protein
LKSIALTRILGLVGPKIQDFSHKLKFSLKYRFKSKLFFTKFIIKYFDLKTKNKIKEFNAKKS